MESPERPVHRSLSRSMIQFALLLAGAMALWLLVVTFLRGSGLEAQLPQTSGVAVSALAGLLLLLIATTGFAFLSAFEARNEARARRQSEQALLLALEAARDARREAERAEADRSAFLAAMAHEINNPMTPIRLQSHVLRQHLDNHAVEAAIESLDLLERSSRRLAELGHDVLDASRAQTNRLQLQSAPFDLALVAQDAIEEHRTLADENGVDLVFENNGPVPAKGDASRISQVLVNLLSNAIRHTPTGGKVTLACQLTEDGPEVRVTDTGVGIQEDKLADIFQPFRRLGNDVHPGIGGTGLGLFIAKGIAEAHGGTLVAWNETERGCTFRLALPHEPPAGPADEGDAADEAGTASTETSKPAPEDGSSTQAPERSAGTATKRA